jgi:hypothetical protein
MAQPDIRGKVVGGPLANVSVQYRNQSYIGDRVFPIIDRVGSKDKIIKYSKGAWFRDEAGIRAPGDRARRGGFDTEYLSITPVQYAYAKEVTDEDVDAAKEQGAPPLNPVRDAIEFATDKIDLKKERLVAALVLGTTWSGGNEDAAGGWAAGDNNTFITDVETRIETIRKNTGFRPNVLMLTANILPEIKQESTVLDRIKYTERGIVTPALIAAMLELEEVLIGDAIYSTAAEKADGSDFTAKNIWETNADKGSAFLYYRPKRPGLKIPSAGYQARRPISGKPRRTMTWREEAEHQSVYEVAEDTDILAVGADLGFLWNDCIAT